MWGKFRASPWWAQAALWLVLWPFPLALLTLSRPSADRRAWWAVTACSGLVWVGIGASSNANDSEAVEAGAELEPNTPTTVGTSTTQPSATTTTEQLTASTFPPAPEGGHRSGDIETADVAETDQVVRTPEADALLAALTALPIEVEHARSGYERALFLHWDDDDGDGCDTRCEVLSAQRRPDGMWLSEWDGYTADDTSELHVDHVVALAEAWDSGADQWTTAQRDEFADDTTNLLAVTAASNVAKSDRDAAEWFPSRADANCLWASTVVRVKVTWGLTVDQAERDALGNVLRTCTDYQPPTTTTAPATTTTRLPVTAPPTTAAPAPPAQTCTPGYTPCIPPGDDVDCAGGTGNGPRYIDGPVSVDHAYGDPYGLDGNDNDGIGCES